MSASGLPITQLGSTIKSHLGIAEKYEGKAEEHYKSAGIHLLEAKARIASGEYEGKFGMFLMRECNDLSDSRAYELIAIANGTKTVENIRERAREGMRASRAKAANVKRQREELLAAILAAEALRKAQTAASAPDPIRNVTEPSDAEVPRSESLAARRAAAHAEAAAIRRMPGYVPYDEPAEVRLAYQIEAACRGVAVEQLQYVLNYLRAAKKSVTR